MAVDSGSDQTIVLAALGRPFSLGMLYDCRNESLIPALTLWDQEALEKEADERPQPNSDFEIIASDSIDSKTTALNVNASLKASFMSGMVDVEGSAKYLSNSKTSTKHARVTLKYSATTKFQQLSMNLIGPGNMKYPDVLRSGQATHVVTGILYGAQAFFVFDQEVSENEHVQDIEGNLKVKINNIPGITIDGDGSLKMEGKEISDVDKFSCKFHGDFFLKKNPVSFKAAVEVCKILPTLLGPNGGNAVPQKVWLLPLKSLDAGAAGLVRQISEKFINDATNALEDLSELERRCNDAVRCTTIQQFPQIKKKVKTFKELVSQHKLQFMNMMAKKLPLIRSGKEKECAFAKILEKVHSSPFKNDELNEWMDCKETETKIISSLIDNTPNMTIVSSRSTLQLEINNADITYAVCFVFTSLEGQEPYLSALSKYLEPDSVQCADDDGEKEPWFFSPVAYKKIKLFKDFAKANKEKKSIRFLATAISDNEKKGATLHLYKDGSLETDNFEPPLEPEMTTDEITHNSVTLKFPGLTDVTDYVAEFCVHGNDVWHQEMVSKDGKLKVTGLQMNEEYQFRVRAKSAVGFSLACEALIKTLPCGPPELQYPECDCTAIKLTWKKTTELGSGVEIVKYILEYFCLRGDGYNIEKHKLTLSANEPECTHVITELHPLTRYTISVKCDCGVAGLGGHFEYEIWTTKLQLN